MAVKYGGLLKFTDEIKAEINLAADGTVEKAVLIDGDGVETPIGGGGGSSDFSTAEVTVINTGGSLTLYGANAIDDGEDTGSAYGLAVSTDETAVFTVILYKGVAWINKGTASSIVSVSGSAEKLGSTMVKVTGDCTITIS